MLQGGGLFKDAIVFDAVLAFGSTLKAAELLDVPQSSVSRRYRQHARELNIELVRTSDAYRVDRGQYTLDMFRRFACAYRLVNNLNRFAVHPALLVFFAQNCVALPGQLLRLSKDDWGQWLALGIIDSILDCQIRTRVADPPFASSNRTLFLGIAQSLSGSDSSSPAAKRVYLGDLALIKGLAESVEAFGWEVVAFQHPDHAFALLRPLRCSYPLPASGSTLLSAPKSLVQSVKAPVALPMDTPRFVLDPTIELAIDLVWTHPAACADQDLELLRKLSEFQFAIDSFIDAQACLNCSGYDFLCPNSI